MSHDELLRLTHAYHEDALSDGDAARLAEAVANDAQARQALALDGHIAVALGDERAADAALLSTLRAHWPVRSPSSARHQRPRTGTFKRRRPSSRAWVAAALVLIAVLGVALGWPRPATATTSLLVVAPLTITQDHATIDRGGLAQALTGSRPLMAGDRLVVPSGATVALSGRQEATVIHLNGPAELTLGSDQPGKHLILRRGHLTATVAPQPAGHPLVISCPFSDVTVVGTTFSITAGEHGDRIEVRHGNVRVAATNGGAELLLAAGHTAEAGPTRALALVDGGHRDAPTKTTKPTSVTVGDPSSWYDFSTANGAQVANRIPGGAAGTLIDALIRSEDGDPAAQLSGGNSRFTFPLAPTKELTVSLRLRRERQPSSDSNPVLLALPRLVLYTNLGQTGEVQRTDDSLHLITRSGPPIAGWSTNGQVVRYGAWQHVVLTLAESTDGAVVPTVWIDGERQQLWPWKGDWPQGSPDPQLGAIGIEPGVQRSIAGLADDLRIWPRVLSDAEIITLANGR